MDIIKTLTHPVSRKRIITEKLFAVLIQIAAMNIIIYALSVGSVAAIGEKIPWKEITLLHLAYYLLQTELAGICFGISAFIRKGGAGVGLGIAVLMYFLNIIANIADVAEFLKYITPFGYCEGADIVSGGQSERSNGFSRHDTLYSRYSRRLSEIYKKGYSLINQIINSLGVTASVTPLKFGFSHFIVTDIHIDL